MMIIGVNLINDDRIIKYVTLIISPVSFHLFNVAPRKFKRTYEDCTRGSYYMFIEQHFPGATIILARAFA